MIMRSAGAVHNELRVALLTAVSEPTSVNSKCRLIYLTVARDWR
jgi:hypothetical protein